MKNTFTFDLLGASPQRLRANLEKFAKHDFVFVQGKILNNALNNPEKQKRALAFIKGAKQNQTPRNKKLLFAVHMYRQADKLENEREMMGGAQFTVGVDYQTVLDSLRQKTMMGKDEGIQHQIRVYAKTNKLWGKSDKQKDKWKWVKQELIKANFPPNEIDAVIKARKKTLEKHKKERWTKVLNVAKTVGKIALSAAKIVPGVGDAVKAAEKMVKEIPGVKEALDLADKVKGTIKEAKALGDTAKLDKLKDLGKNPKVVDALNVDKVVRQKIQNTVQETKQTQTANVLDVAEKIVPGKMQVAMKLVKAAKEMNPTALSQIQNIQKLAETGVYEAQKAIQAMKVAVNIQDAAKEQAFDEYRMWQYW